MSIELKFASIDLHEKNNLSVILNNKKYNGWYKYVLDTIENEKEYIDVVVRFRIPLAIKIYDDVLRNFTKEERLVGIHRMLVGKDLQDEVKEILKHDDVNDYLETLTDEEVNSFLKRMEKIVTFDCNKIPYLHIRQNKEEFDEEKVGLIVKNFLDNQIDYITIFKDVLNERITITKATELSNNIIYNEQINLLGEK